MVCGFPKQLIVHHVVLWLWSKGDQAFTWWSDCVFVLWNGCCNSDTTPMWLCWISLPHHAQSKFIQGNKIKKSSRTFWSDSEANNYPFLDCLMAYTCKKYLQMGLFSYLHYRWACLHNIYIADRPIFMPAPNAELLDYTKAWSSLRAFQGQEWEELFLQNHFSWEQQQKC